MHLKPQIPITRILWIVKRLYRLEKLNTLLLAKEYDLSRRTIHRDLLKISKIIPLTNKKGLWSLDGKGFSTEDNHFCRSLLLSFAHNLQIEIDCLEKNDLTRDKVGFAIEYRHLPKKLGEEIMRCIENEKSATFNYYKPNGTTFRMADPIKIYTESGRWYLIAKDHRDNRVKTFNLSKIKDFKHSSLPYTLTDDMLNAADELTSIWSSIDKKEEVVKLYISPEAAPYIRDIKLHKTQIIEDEHHDGGMEVHCTITHRLEILPQIKYWLPRVHILEPKWLWEGLMKDLAIYQYEDQKMRYE